LCLGNAAQDGKRDTSQREFKQDFFHNDLDFEVV
jgi:hypothetical protein